MVFSLGETVASAVVKEAVNLIRVTAESEVGLLWSFKDDLEAMGDTLEIINVSLKDADAAPARDGRARLLLGRLKAAAHDIEDLLEEFADAGTRGCTNWFCKVNWLTSMASSLSNLVNLELDNFIGCDELPPLHLLEKLCSLTLRHIPNLKTVHENISGVSNSLPMLRTLKIESMPNLERWYTVQANDVQIFPVLQLLKVYNCPKLKFVPFLPACSKCIINSSTEALMLGHLNNSLWDMPTSELSCLFLHGACTGLQHFKFLMSLSVLGCTKLSSWQESIISIASLQKLELCQSEIPEWLHQLSSLRELHIIKCKNPLNLSQFVKAPHQIALTIEDCRETLAKVPHEVILAMIRQVTTVQIIGCEPIMHAEWRNGELFKCKLRKSSKWYMKPADAGSLPDVLGTWQEEPTEFCSGDITDPDQPGPSGTK